MPPGLCDLERGANKAWTAEDVRIEVTRGHVIEAWANRGNGGNRNERITARGEHSTDHR